MGQSNGEYETTATHPDVVTEPPKKAIEKDDVLSMLAYHLDAMHYQRLEEAHPEIARILDLAVRAGWRPEELGRWALERQEHNLWARWLEQSARYLAAEGDGE